MSRTLCISSCAAVRRLRASLNQVVQDWHTKRFGCRGCGLSQPIARQRDNRRCHPSTLMRVANLAEIGEAPIRAGTSHSPYTCLNVVCSDLARHTLNHLPRADGLKLLLLTSLLLNFAFRQIANSQTAVTNTTASPVATPTKSAPSLEGSINGRVVGDDGQSLANARVFAIARGSARRPPAAAVSGLDGKFTLKNLARGAYNLNAWVPGYFDSAVLELERGNRRYYRPGDAPEIRMTKGGVITGRVTNAEGEPVIATRVNAVRVRDLEGRLIRELNAFSRSLERTTDDRGIFRMYGLLPGVYLVSAGGRMSWGWGDISAYDNDAPTYHPSTTRDATNEVTVRAGQEVADIDIRYRGATGHAVSGTIPGASKAAESEGPVFLILITAGTTGYEGTAYFSGRDGNESFAFDGLGDGDYDLIAERRSNEGDLIAAATQRVSVRGADVTGLKLALVPLASLSGRLVIEPPLPPLPADQQTQCQPTAPAQVEEIVVVARRNAVPLSGEIVRPGGEASTAEAAPDQQGAFTLRGLDATTYLLQVQLPRGQFYLRSLKLANAATAANAAPVKDPVLHGVTLRAGERSSGLTITVAHGAASLNGRIVARTTDNAAGTNIDDAAGTNAVRVYLIPAEPERADELLRYAETAVTADGSFAFDALAPGRYWLHAAPAPTGQPADAPAITNARPLAWDPPTRAILRRQAEAGKQIIEFKPCQRVADFTLPLR